MSVDDTEVVSDNILMGKPVRPDHIAIYIRWSTEDQATGTTLDVQTDRCTAYVRSQGWQVSSDLIFVDDGYSGGTLDRPAMTRLRQRVREGDVDCVVVMKTDRLSRNIVDAVNLVLREWDGRCYFKSALEPIDTTTELGRMIFGILAMFADFERSTISERTQTGKLRRIAEGKQMHARPAFGYMRHPSDKGRWVENPEESPIVRRMFDMAASGLSAHQIGRALNGEGIRTRQGRMWSLRSVLWVLHNRTYIGEVVYGRTTFHRQRPGEPDDPLSPPTPRSKRVLNDVPKVAAATDAVTPLVGRKTWERVQALIDGHRWARESAGGSRALGSEHLLVGIAKCSCGYGLVYKETANGSKTARHGYYICARARLGSCRETGYIPSAAVEAMIEAQFLALFGIPDVRQERLRPHFDQVNGQREALSAALATAQRKERQYADEEQRILRAARSGEIDLQLVSDMRSSLRRDREMLAAETSQIKGQLDGLSLKERGLLATLEALDSLEQWKTLPIWQKRQLLRLVMADKLTITKPRGRNEIKVETAWAF